MSRQRIKTGVERYIVRSRLPDVYARAMRNESIAVLAYHRLTQGDSFAEQMELLRSTATPLHLEEVTGCLRAGRWPRRAALVTFDDGDRSLVEVALPILRAANVPAAAFVVTAVLDTRSPFWWTEVEELVTSEGDASERRPQDVVRAMKGMTNDDRLQAIARLRRAARTPPIRMEQLHSYELRDLESHGVVVGNHTQTHPCLPRCNERAVQKEIELAHCRLEEALGHEPTTFAYPNGDWDPRAERVLRQLGYGTAFLFDHHISRLRTLHPLRVSRVRVSDTVSMDRFRLIVSGLHPALHRLRGGR